MAHVMCYERFYSQYQVLSTGILGTVSGATAEEQINCFPLICETSALVICSKIYTSQDPMGGLP